MSLMSLSALFFRFSVIVYKCCEYSPLHDTSSSGDFVWAAGVGDGGGLAGESGDAFSKAETRFSTSRSRSSTLRCCPHTDANRAKNTQKIETHLFIGTKRDLTKNCAESFGI